MKKIRLAQMTKGAVGKFEDGRRFVVTRDYDADRGTYSGLYYTFEDGESGEWHYEDWRTTPMVDYLGKGKLVIEVTAPA